MHLVRNSSFGFLVVSVYWLSRYSASTIPPTPRNDWIGCVLGATSPAMYGDGKGQRSAQIALIFPLLSRCSAHVVQESVEGRMEMVFRGYVGLLQAPGPGEAGTPRRAGCTSHASSLPLHFDRSSWRVLSDALCSHTEDRELPYQLGKAVLS